MDKGAIRTVLLTGGAGFIGSHICVELVKSGYEVIIADNFVNSSPVVISRLKQLTGRDFKFYEVDVCDAVAFERVFVENHIDATIHLAGLKAVGESVSKPLEYYRNNLNATITLCNLMSKYDVKHIIFSSSATVYGVPSSVPLNEDMPTSCTNPYGWTKMMSEQIIRDVCSTNEDWSAVLLRYFNPVGAHESGMIGEDPNGVPNNLMPYISQVASGTLPYLQVFGNDYDTCDGTGVRDYIHVVDLANGHVSALDYVRSNRGVDVFNLGTGKGSSVLEMVKAFEIANGVEVPYKFVPRRNGDVAECWADTEKANVVLRWKSQRTVEDMCRDMWRWQCENPNGYGTR